MDRAGTGKTFVVANTLEIARAYYKDAEVAAYALTNHAATSIDGMTINKLLGFPGGLAFSERSVWRFVKANRRICESVRGMKVLVVDEI